MKSALILVISPLFLIGVVGNTDEVSVMEGDSITLHTDVTEILTDDEIEWRLNKTRIARITNEKNISLWISSDQRFRDRLKLNSQTGDLKIRNIRITDFGEYKLKITTTTRGTTEKTFTVRSKSDADKDPVKMVLGTVGGFVTLKPEKKSHELIQWRYGTKSTLIAELLADSSTVYGDVPDGRFRGRLKLNIDTGSLNITNITITDSGDYEAGIRSRGSRYTIHKTFSVNVRDVKPESVKEGNSVTLHTDLIKIQTNDVILWRFGDQDDIIARLNSPDVDPKWSNFNLNETTGDLTISNIRKDQSGDYKVEINTINMISYRKYHVIVSEIVTLELVMEGDSVTLHTGSSEISRNYAIQWSGDKNTRITPLPGYIDQNDRNGDLTIRNIRRNQSGDYKVIFTDIQTLFTSIHRKFHITITDVFSNETGGVKTVSVMKGESASLNTSVTEIQKGDLIEWLFGPQNITIAKTDGKSNSISYNDKDVRFKNRLNLDIQTGNLTIKNSSSEHSGRYQLKIINNTYTIQKSFSVTVSVVPDSGLSPGAIAGIVTAVAAVAAAVGGAFYYRHKRSIPQRSSVENGQNHTSNKDEETELTS